MFLIVSDGFRLLVKRIKLFQYFYSSFSLNFSDGLTIRLLARSRETFLSVISASGVRFGRLVGRFPTSADGAGRFLPRFRGVVAAAGVANGSVIMDVGTAVIMRVDAGAAKTPWFEVDDVIAFSPSFPEVPSDKELRVKGAVENVTFNVSVELRLGFIIGRGIGTNGLGRWIATAGRLSKGT